MPSSSACLICSSNEAQNVTSRMENELPNTLPLQLWLLRDYQGKSLADWSLRIGTYNKDLCRSSIIVASNCGQLTSTEILISCLKCATVSGSFALDSAFLDKAEDDCERLSSLSDAPFSNVSNVRRNAEGRAFPEAESVDTSMLEGSSDKVDINCSRVLWSQYS